MRSSFRIALVLILALSMPEASFAAPAGTTPEPDRSVLNHIGSFLAALWIEIGGHIDPDGAADRENPEPVINQDIGCHIDPSGACRD